jgi:hypothetical protein
MALEPEFPSDVSKVCSIRAFQLFNRLLFQLGMGEMRAAGALNPRGAVRDNIPPRTAASVANVRAAAVPCRADVAPELFVMAQVVFCLSASQLPYKQIVA